jgi:type II secretory pathway component GspD/PulD (secretin)
LSTSGARRLWCAAVGLLTWASVAAHAQQRATLPPLPLMQLDDRSPAADLDNRTFNMTFAQAVAVRDLLLLVVRGTSLSVVPDPGVDGSFIGELKNVTVRQALNLILQPLGFQYRVEGTVVRVFRREPETRIFDVNYVATVRTSESIVAADGTGRTRADVSTSSRTDLFGELAVAVKPLLSEKGTFSIDRKAGLLQATDFPERLDRIGLYLDAMHDRVHRQIQVDAQVIEVELGDETAAGIDWDAVRARLGGVGSADRSRRRSLTGMRATDASKLLDALRLQGTLSMIASPSLTVVNNEPAIVRTDSVSLGVTPQAGGDGAVMLSVTPIVKAGPQAAGASSRAIVSESDMLARVADGETLVIGGFTHERETREKKNLGARGGWFGRGTVVTRRKVELVVLITPRVIAGVNAQ